MAWLLGLGKGGKVCQAKSVTPWFRGAWLAVSYRTKAQSLLCAWKNPSRQHLHESSNNGERSASFDVLKHIVAVGMSRQQGGLCSQRLSRSTVANSCNDSAVSQRHPPYGESAYLQDLFLCGEAPIMCCDRPQEKYLWEHCVLQRNA